MLDKYVENDDPSKVRKSLLTVALLTILFANVKFASNELSLLGLTVVVEQPRLVALGQIASIFLLVTYMLRSFPQLVKAFEEAALRRQERHKKLAHSRLMSAWDFDALPDYDDGPQGDFDAHEREFGSLEKKTRDWFQVLIFWASAVATISLDFLVPITLGIVAGTSPFSLSHLISYITKS